MYKLQSCMLTKTENPCLHVRLYIYPYISVAYRRRKHVILVFVSSVCPQKQKREQEENLQMSVIKCLMCACFSACTVV